MPDFYTIHRRDMLQQAESLAGMSEAFPVEAWSACCDGLGCYEEKKMSLGEVSLNQIRATFDQGCKLQVQNQQLPGFVNICLPLQGNIGTNFHRAHLHTNLAPGRHHFLYIPETEYELVIHKQVWVAHLQVCLRYFVSLLCTAEAWSASLHEKLTKKEMVYSGDGLVCSATRRVLEDMVNCRFSGATGKLFLEAKVLELLALQLDHYQRTCSQNVTSINKKDRDTLHALRESLTTSFHHQHSLQSLSLAFGVNEFKLKKQFKALFGQTIFDFIFDLKMEHAKHLLLNEGRYVNEVAREVGYKNSNHFSTAFRKKFGINPASLKS